MDFDKTVTKNDGIYIIKPKDEFPLSLLISLKSILKKEGYITYEIENRRIDTGGGNYLGDLYEVDVRGRTANGDKETNIFIKNILPGDSLKFLSITEVYLRELYTYTELFKIYDELQTEAKVPTEERFKTVKSYDSNPEAIFLENMTNKGFTTGHRMDVISLEFAEQSIQQLAKFHALSFILQKRKPEYFDRKLKVIKSPFRTDDDVWMNFAKNMCNTTLGRVKDNLKEKMMKLVPVFIEKYKLFISDETKLGCLCHCDYRQNNILMNETNGVVSEVIPVDYQLIHYGCPLNDFFYFIFSGTDREFRRKHLIHIKNMYYDTFEKFLNYFDMDICDVFPKEEFERIYKERMYYGLVVGIFFLPFIFVTGDAPDLGKDDLTSVQMKLDGSFDDRLQGIIEDFMEWGYL